MIVFTCNGRFEVPFENSLDGLVVGKSINCGSGADVCLAELHGQELFTDLMGESLPARGATDAS